MRLGPSLAYFLAGVLGIGGAIAAERPGRPPSPFGRPGRIPPSDRRPPRALVLPGNPPPRGAAAVVPVLEGVLETERSPHGLGNVYAPEVRFDGAVYRMWYGGQGRDGHDRIHLAVSQDGREWTRRGVVLSEAGVNHINDPSVVRVGDAFFMYYSRAEAGLVDVVALATSRDGVHWQPRGTAVGPGPRSRWDGLCVGRPSVLHEDNVFKMWFDGRNELPIGAAGENAPNTATSARSVGFATSPDGLHWTKHPANPVHGGNAGGVDVKRIDGVYVMAYESGEGTRVSVSPDGISWTPRGIWIPRSGRDFDRYGQVTPMILVGPGGRLDSLFCGVAAAASWDRNAIVRIRLTPAQVALIAGIGARAVGPGSNVASP